MPDLCFNSPLGAIYFACDQSGLISLDFSPVPINQEASSPEIARLTRLWLQCYFAGVAPEIEIPLNTQGTPFQKRVWKQLGAVAYGQTCSYSELAKRLNTSARAIGGAMRANPIALVIPCHRVIGKNGQLTGYAGGLERKAWLLKHEANQRPQ